MVSEGNALDDGKSIALGLMRAVLFVCGRKTYERITFVGLLNLTWDSYAFFVGLPSLTWDY
jgi:hypothetical protein